MLQVKATKNSKEVPACVNDVDVDVLRVAVAGVALVLSAVHRRGVGDHQAAVQRSTETTKTLDVGTKRIKSVFFYKMEHCVVLPRCGLVSSV